MTFDRWDDDPIPEPREYGQWVSYVVVVIALAALVAYALLAASLGH